MRFSFACTISLQRNVEPLVSVFRNLNVKINLNWPPKCLFNLKFGFELNKKFFFLQIYLILAQKQEKTSKIPQNSFPNVFISLFASEKKLKKCIKWNNRFHDFKQMERNMSTRKNICIKKAEHNKNHRHTISEKKSFRCVLWVHHKCNIKKNFFSLVLIHPWKIFLFL